MVSRLIIPDVILIPASLKSALSFKFLHNIHCLLSVSGSPVDSGFSSFSPCLASLKFSGFGLPFVFLFILKVKMGSNIEKVRVSSGSLRNRAERMLVMSSITLILIFQETFG